MTWNVGQIMMVPEHGHSRFLRTPEGIGDSPDGGCQEHMHKTHSTFK